MDFQPRKKIDAHIDMTPMIDTLLQLFLIFLISTTFVASAVRLDLPKAAVNQKPVKDPITVTLDADNRMFLNKDPIAGDELQRKLERLLPKAAKPEVLLRADQSLPYKHVMAAIAQIKGAGADTVHLAYDEERKR